jgi:hypothetical protein
VPHRPQSAGDALPQRCAVIEIRVAELRQLFNAIDPSPFHQRDLDPRAEEFIVDWASDLPADRPWGLVVHLDRPAGWADEAAALREAIHEYFGQRVLASRRRLRELFAGVASASSSHWHFSPRPSRLVTPSPATSATVVLAKSFAKVS